MVTASPSGQRRQPKRDNTVVIIVTFAFLLTSGLGLVIWGHHKKSDQHLDKLDRGNDNENYIPGEGGPDLTRMVTRMEGSNTFLGLLQWITCIAAAVFFLVLFCLVLAKCAEIHEVSANDAEAAPGTVVQPTVDPMETGEPVLTNITVVTDDPEMKMLPLIVA